MPEKVVGVGEGARDGWRFIVLVAMRGASMRDNEMKRYAKLNTLQSHFSTTNTHKHISLLYTALLSLGLPLRLPQCSLPNVLVQAVRVRDE